MEEIWENIEGYENYQVSSRGRVRSLDRLIKAKNGSKALRKGYILKPIKNRDGYLRVGLWKDGKLKNYKVHRLVLQAFVPNPDNLPQVNHKNEVKTDNFVYVDLDGTINTEKSNLEWCNRKYNINYGSRNQRVAEKNTNGKLSKPVLQFDKQGNFIKEWPSISEIKRLLGYNTSHISECCNGKIHFKTANGYIWKYKEERAA